MAQNHSTNYYKSLRERDAGPGGMPGSDREFPEPLDIRTSPVDRRRFLKLAGFAFGAGSVLTGCKRSAVEKAIPFLIQPEEITPGKAVYFASTCAGCDAGCGMLVKNRDGRPIKLEGNPSHPVSKGGLCAVGQASILGLYDSHRLRGPMQDGQPATWDAVDKAVAARLEEIKRDGGSVRFLSGTVNSPTTSRVIREFLGQFGDARHIVFDSLSCSAILDAHEQTHGRRVLPRYRFDEAEVIVGFDADFLGTWISPVEFTKGYSAGRRPGHEGNSFSYHAQFESRMSTTGSKADQRVRVAPSEIGAVINHLAARVAEKAGARFSGEGLGPVPVNDGVLDRLTERLWHAREKSLVVCGVNNVQTQIVCNFINNLLDGYGRTLDVQHPSNQKQGDDTAMDGLIDELAGGGVSALFILNANPVADLPDSAGVEAAIGSAGLVVDFARHTDETAAHAHFVCPDHHELESWSDVEAVSGVVSFRQPIIAPLGETRAAIESLSAWTGRRRTGRELLADTWPDQSFRDRVLHDGHADITHEGLQALPFNAAEIGPAPVAAGGGGAFELVLYTKAGMLDGRSAGNPWLHELPDPISKVVWENYASLSPDAAERLGVDTNDIVRIEAAGKTGGIELPVYVQPGQHDGTIAVALGYGRKASARFADIGPDWIEKRGTLGKNGLVGTNAAPLLAFEHGALRGTGRPVNVSVTGKSHPVVTTQDYHYITVPKHLAPAGHERRPMIQE
ncbi:MAG: hypothetical protein K8E66_01920, partial [Phycisphaerales bacterium]|nr:hypothetical protein [Phycisphaerales bacterium]